MLMLFCYAIDFTSFLWIPQPGVVKDLESEGSHEYIFDPNFELNFYAGIRICK